MNNAFAFVDHLIVDQKVLESTWNSFASSFCFMVHLNIHVLDILMEFSMSIEVYFVIKIIHKLV
jgi:hypothetical protein